MKAKIKCTVKFSIAHDTMIMERKTIRKVINQSTIHDLSDGSSLNTRVSANEASIASLLSSSSGSSSVTQADITSLQDQITSSNTDVAALTTRVSTNENDIATNTGGLQTTNAAVATKASTSSLSALNSRVTATETALVTKQDTITAGQGLSFAGTTLNAALPTISQDSSTLEISLPNTCYVFHTTGQTEVFANSTFVYPNMYKTNSVQVNSTIMPRIQDSAHFDVINPNDSNIIPETGGASANQSTGTNAQFGIQLKTAGLYKITYHFNLENESATSGQRRSLRTNFEVLWGANGANVSFVSGSMGTEYVRDNDEGQYCNIAGVNFIQIAAAQLGGSNGGVFLRVRLMANAVGEFFQTSVDGIKLGHCAILVELVA